MPVSLLHSSKIPADELGGVPAATWRQFLLRKMAEGVRRFRVIPLFFGPSSAIVDYLPKVTEQVSMDIEGVDCFIADTLVPYGNPEDDVVARLLRDLIIRDLNTSLGKLGEGVILVDHGSPVREVAECRDRVAGQLRRLLGLSESQIIASSMERREGELYSFNEPLLEGALEMAKSRNWKRVVLSQMFFSPGRHAGPGGDIQDIVEASQYVKEGGRVDFAPLVGRNPALVDLLAIRYEQSLERG
ncbi:sirohydrochlorin chelatase [Pelagicoccus albus]|uniref:Cobalamin biosynthesis protein CbiX n=1 Tax=Pelagicoccus albus TaxID=415222 RepID=A0A7X1E7G6_9BACT|nr:CbiX/SirB N-terminal domain-containing protein [Pelagicoccus albus]MBC2605181.1 cobalamin biosynthesis protein CbiX [Pelagicoccus albus]